MRVVVVGSLNMDLVVHVPRLPAAGETVVGTDFVRAHGGKGSNQAVAARRMAADVRLVGRVGADAFGDELIAALTAEGIDMKSVQRAERPTGVALITVDERGENTIAVAAGANAALRPSDVDQAAIAAADVCIAQLEVPTDTVLAAFRDARANGITTLLNAAPARADLPVDLWRVTTVCVVNVGELAMIEANPEGDGPESGGRDEVVARAGRLLERGPRVVIVTRGADETLLLTAGHAARWSTPPRVTAVDTVGAGDAFVGTLAANLTDLTLEGLARAVAIANAAGALAATRRGAQPSLPRREEVDDLLRSQEV